MPESYRAFSGVTDPFSRRDAWAVVLGSLATLVVGQLLRLLDRALLTMDASKRPAS
jgi:hypothetical protein